MRFLNRTIKAQPEKTPALVLERPRYDYKDALPDGYSLTIKFRGEQPKSFYHLKNVMVGAEYVTAVASDRTSFHYPYFNIDWFSVSKEGDL